MGQRIIITESEKNQIRSLYEQVVQGTGSDPYEYKKEGDKYFARKKGSPNWIQASGNISNAIATKIFRTTTTTPETTTKTTPETKTSSLPFKNSVQGNQFREWVNNTHPDYAKSIGLDIQGSHTNTYIQKAWLKYGKEYSSKKIQTLPALDNSIIDKYKKDLIPRSDYLGPGGKFETGLFGGMNKENYIKFQETISKLPVSKRSSLPLHLRALMDYLSGREDPFTSADLTRDEQIFLKNIAIPNAKKGLTYPLWKEIGAGDLPTAMTVSGSQKEKEKLDAKGGQGSLLKPELSGQFMYTLGEVSPSNIKVTPDKSRVTVYDRYDFNTQGKNKEQLLQSLVSQIGSLWKGNATAYSVIRNVVAFKESGGYKGFPVEITV